MIPAEPTRFHRAMLARYFRRRLATSFHSIAAAGLSGLAPWGPAGGATRPLILLANHSCWWDAVLPIYLSLDLLRQDAYGIMEERQLQRYRFFRRAGIFSIDRENPRSAMQTLDYAARLLQGRRRVLWLFPQGEIVPNDRRPIECAPGAAHLIAKLGECAIVPVALRYEMLGEERPFAWVGVGSVVDIDAGRQISTRDVTEQIHALLTDQADLLRNHVIDGQTGEFSEILHGKRSIDLWWDQVRGRQRER